MKLSILFMLTSLLIGVSSAVLARDVHVKGYYRKDGTYIRSHIRSSPDGIRSNNYGPSRSDHELMNPRSRDTARTVFRITWILIPIMTGSGMTVIRISLGGEGGKLNNGNLATRDKHS